MLYVFSICPIPFRFTTYHAPLIITLYKLLRILQAPVKPRAETTRELGCKHLFHQKCIGRSETAAHCALPTAPTEDIKMHKRMAFCVCTPSFKAHHRLVPS